MLVVLTIGIFFFQESFASSPADSPPDENALVSVSTTFFPGAQLHSLPPDLVLLSSDSVFFYVHLNLLLCTSDNNFNSLLPPPPKATLGPMGPIVMLPESSAVLNIVLHSIYDISCAHYSPSFESLSAALVFMAAHGISVKQHVARSTALYALFLSHAPLYPLELYALAASYDLYDLAVPTSSHLLSFPLASLTDEMADRIGPRYLKRLFFLHFGRTDALKRLLLPPPHPHSPTMSCDFTEQKKLTRAWALASAYLAWDARPGMLLSVTDIKRVMNLERRPVNKHDRVCSCPSGRPIILRPVQSCPAREIEIFDCAVVRCEGTHAPSCATRALI